MQDLALWLAGGLAIFAALAHSVIGERYVFPKVRIEPTGFTLLFRTIWHCLSAGWLAGAVLLLALPGLDADRARRCTIIALAVLYASAAFGNAIATGGRHFGWAVLTTAALLLVSAL